MDSVEREVIKRPPHFLDLPQEIRDLIYLYFREMRWVDITQMPANLEQPSITKVSRRIRQESLAVFYGRNWFMLDMRGWKHSSYPRKWTPGHIFNRWVSAIGDGNAARLRRLHFYSHNFVVYFQINPEASPQITARFRLTRSNALIGVAEEAPRGYSLAVAAQRAEKRLLHVLAGLPASASDGPLSCADIRTLCDTVASLQPIICTRYNIGYKGAVITQDETAVPTTAMHEMKCEECGYHRILWPGT